MIVGRNQRSAIRGSQSMTGYVDRVVLDEWAGVYCDYIEICSPKLADVVWLFSKLDAAVHTILTLQARDGTSLVVGGGAGQYLVYVSTSDEEYSNLLSQPDTKSVVMIFVGGQEGDCPARQAGDGGRALRSTRRTTARYPPVPSAPGTYGQRPYTCRSQGKFGPGRLVPTTRRASLA
jgi:hypothetical protein